MTFAPPPRPRPVLAPRPQPRPVPRPAVPVRFDLPAPDALGIALVEPVEFPPPDEIGVVVQ